MQTGICSGDRRAETQDQTLGGNDVQKGIHPIKAKAELDWSTFDHQQRSEAATQRVLLMSGMATVSVVLLAIAGYLHLQRPPETLQTVAQLQAPAQLETQLLEEEGLAPRIEPDALPVRTLAALPASVEVDDAIEVVSRAPLPAETLLPAAPLEPIEPEVGRKMYELSAQAPCVSKLQHTARDLTLYFELSSAILDVEQLEKTRRIGEALAACPEAALQLWGHADESGDEVANFDLSQERARSILAAFSAMGYDTGRIEAVAFGDTRPNTKGVTDTSYDRRVEFRVIPKPVIGE